MQPVQYCTNGANILLYLKAMPERKRLKDPSHTVWEYQEQNGCSGRI